MVYFAPQFFLLVYPNVGPPDPTSPLVLQPPGLQEPSLPPLPVSAPPTFWMNVSSLTPWLADFHTVQFTGNSAYFFVFKLVVVLLLVVGAGTVCLPVPPPCGSFSLY